jgi:hypothetical protein
VHLVEDDEGAQSAAWREVLTKPEWEKVMTEAQAPRHGLLLAMMQPPPSMEEEFQDWYDTEHFPERAHTKGFLTAARFTCLDGWPRYLALYDLANPEVLRGPDYARIAGHRYSAWTRRVVPRVWGHYRAEGVQVYPGDGLLGGKGRFARVAVWRFRNVPPSAEAEAVNGLRKLYESRPETVQVRVFAVQDAVAADYLGIVEWNAPPGMTRPIEVSALGGVSQMIDLVNVYAPYQREWPVFPPPA